MCDIKIKCSKCQEFLTTDKFYPMNRAKVKRKFNYYCRECKFKIAHEGDYYKNYIKKRREENPFLILFTNTKHSAKKRNRVFELTEDNIREIYDLQEGRCYYTNTILELSIGKEESFRLIGKTLQLVIRLKIAFYVLGG